MSRANTRAIVAELQRLLPNAHAPYSGVHVSCAVETTDGRVCYGVNVENAAYPQGLCAEASAISAAVTQGSTRISCVYVASSLPETVWPCGGCRQKIFEFAQDGCEIVAVSPDGELARRTIEQLLPLGFRLEPGAGHRV
ncbi:cytidine deaminase [Phenylobacterium sp.]|uniref:cytidine deaminase n=1 Tax=Phenylobacterium sp. TaxID=1871053 RepID=UPI002BAFE6E3|nr:cytidine deaminase [Phenylobacterium sp.]HLZ74753.1 cytidine deaminase [Phenylobacterium sp.]